MVAVCAILIMLWIVGVSTAYTLGGFIHILFVVALVLLLVKALQNRRNML
jgi:hypothetical protein